MGVKVEEKQRIEWGKNKALRLEGDRDKKEYFFFHVFEVFYNFHLYLDQCIPYNKKQWSVKAAINTSWISGNITNHGSFTCMIYYVTKTLWNINSPGFHSCLLYLQTELSCFF